MNITVSADPRLRKRAIVFVSITLTVCLSPEPLILAGFDVPGTRVF